jgi:MerR family redox-sensitive transcriptional activator SoxR
MPQLSISQVARRFDLNPSALRYYERIGILPQPDRVSGQRRYDAGVLRRLAVIQRARQVGFSLDEIRHLFFGFEPGTTASKRWQESCLRKRAELDASMERIRTMQALLEKMQHCRCSALEQCGDALLKRLCDEQAATSVPGAG